MIWWSPRAAILAVAASGAALWAKLHWRAATPQSYRRGVNPSPFVDFVDGDYSFDWDLWVNNYGRSPPFNRLPFTPTLACEPAVSTLMDRFDWHVMPKSPFSGLRGCGSTDGMPWVNHSFDDPRTVWAAPNGLQRLLNLAARHFDPARRDRIVLFSGSELALGTAFGRDEAERNSTVRQLRKYFRRIVYQTKDIFLEHVHVAPMGLSWGYMLSLLNDIESRREYPTLYTRGAALVDTVRNAMRHNLSYKTRGVLATVSRVAAWLDDPITMKRAITRMTEFPWDPIMPTKTNSSVRSIARAFESRAKLRGWSSLPSAARVAVELRSLEVMKWWEELPKYRFLLNPMGSGIQTAKTYEALSCLTVPIISRMGYSTFDELVSLGFPLVVIEGWVEVAPENLEKWWQRLSPRLESFRRNCLTVDGYWGMYTGSITYCS